MYEAWWSLHSWGRKPSTAAIYRPHALTSLNYKASVWEYTMMLHSSGGLSNYLVHRPHLPQEHLNLLDHKLLCDSQTVLWVWLMMLSYSHKHADLKLHKNMTVGSAKPWKCSLNTRPFLLHGGWGLGMRLRTSVNVRKSTLTTTKSNSISFKTVMISCA